MHTVPEWVRSASGALVVFQRLHKLDRLILIVLVPLWLVCFSFCLRSVLEPSGFISIFVPVWQAADEYPPALGFGPFVPVEEYGLSTGDRLVEIAGIDIRGFSGPEFFVCFAAAAESHELIPIVAERGGERFEVAVPPIRLGILWPMIPLSLSFLTFGIVILLKAPRSNLARAVFHAFTATALVTAGAFSGAPAITWMSMVVFSTAGLATPPLLVRALQLFPLGVPPQSPLARLLPLPFAALGATQVAMVMGIPYAAANAIEIGTAARAAGVAGLLVVAYLAYWRADPVGRRQLKMCVIGLYCALLPVALAYAWAIARPEDLGIASASQAALVLVPAFIYLAMYRHELFDVDRLLTATAAYNIVLFVLMGLWLFLAPLIGETMSSWVGLPASTGQFAASIGLAALILPAQRHLRPRLEALLFKEQHALEAGLDALCDELASAGDTKSLLRRIGVGLHERVRPESTVIYGRDDDRYVALFVEGRGVAAELPSAGPVAATLRAHHGPLCVDGALAGRGERSTDPFARAALEVLNAAVVVPIGGADGEPATFIALGPKRSGDLYTSTEVHLLRSLADRAALELRGFDEHQFREQSRAMQAAMRRYVPGAIADQIERGDDLEASEREVTVLFVDIRGYSALAEGSEAQEIFSTVNLYTRAVSELVRDAGGTVVEFNGDGMMAVFGAPEELPDKELAAVRAARRIADEVESIEHEGQPLSVGVGVATGLAYVGSIQAADRMIWSAIGNTTNLAARLQSLTREFNVAVIIDASTHSALGGGARHFRRHEEIAIRGRSERFDVFALPKSLEDAPAPSVRA